ncbi:1-acyl-sn-glycerol-3-phosphate acyltransferase [bacterium]|nr:1-acyl-sn-glycerol-3-phosphate acyltransferase [bacterium]MCP5462546.1 1-acyl-sn-glycerol-3-phosphate acyltransferase [bacterium]
MLFLYKTAITLCWIYSKLFFKVKIDGLEEPPHVTGYILTANHTSYFDPFIVAKYVKRPIRFLAFKRFFKHPLSNFFMRRWLAIPIDTESIEKKTLETAIKYLKQDTIVGIFPEGKINKSGQEVQMQTGVALLAMHSRKPILPVRIEGTRNLYRPTIFKKKPITISFKPVIHTEEFINTFEGEGTKKIRNRLIQLIQNRIFL